MSHDLLSVERVSKRFAIGGFFGRGHFNAVDDVSFTVQVGRPEILAIIGESGSGKTTLARMILNTLAPEHRVACYAASPLVKPSATAERSARATTRAQPTGLVP